MSNVTAVQIVDAAYSALALVTGVNRHKWRSWDFQDADLPAVGIYALTNNDDCQSLSNWANAKRTDTLAVEYHGRAFDETWASTADDAANRIKRALLNDAALAGYGTFTAVRSTTKFDVASDQRRVVVELAFDLESEAEYEPLAAVAADLGVVHETDSIGGAGTPDIQAEYHP